MYKYIHYVIIYVYMYMPTQGIELLQETWQISTRAFIGVSLTQLSDSCYEYLRMRMRLCVCLGAWSLDRLH